jgi:hypothetical protein
MALTAQQLATAARRKNRLRELCAAFPEVEADALGTEHIAFKVRKKIFAYYLFDHHDDGKIAFTCKSSLSEQRRLIREDPEEFFVPAYLGSRGWVCDSNGPERRRLDRDRRTRTAGLPPDRPEETRDARGVIAPQALLVRNVIGH